MVWKFRDGKLAYCREYTGREELADAVTTAAVA